jgi:hypothetical protein
MEWVSRVLVPARDDAPPSTTTSPIVDANVRASNVTARSRARVSSPSLARIHLSIIHMNGVTARARWTLSE